MHFPGTAPFRRDSLPTPNVSIFGVQQSSRILHHAIFALVALVAALFVLGKFDPFYIPTIDDSAIVMRYLRNFQHGHFFAYNVQDGPVFGISSFLWGIACGFVSWLGLAPQASIMLVSFISCTLLFYTMLIIFEQLCESIVISIIAFSATYLSLYFTAKALFLGLETPLNLWLVILSFYFFFADRRVAFYITAAFCVISKLDTCLLVAGLAAAHLLRAHLQSKELRRDFVACLIYFVAPIAIWAIFATLVFHSPIPQSFLAKYYLHARAAHTSWFPFFEPFVDGVAGRQSVKFVALCVIGAFILAAIRRTIFIHSVLFAIAAIGTLSLYFIYNPVEKMPWYYPLPELLGIMTVACLPFDAWKIPRRTVAWTGALASVLFFGAIAYTRYPMNADAISQARYWQMVFEKERMESGQLANDVAPKDHPVLWTGHGYPAYLFDGYVADYSGLNTRHIWRAIKAVRKPDAMTSSFLQAMGLADAPPTAQAEYFLIKLHDANVFMKHDLFTPAQQRYLGIRLAGSFYTIAMVNAPAFRVFVKDETAPEINQALPLDRNTGRKSNGLSALGDTIHVTVPTRTSRVDFGVKMEDGEQTVLLKSQGGETIGQCTVPSLASLHLPVSIHACHLSLNRPSNAAVDAELMRSDAKPLEVFEPSAAEVLDPHAAQG